MADLPRLNNIIKALEAGQHALTCFAPAHVDSAIAMSASKYDGCVFEMEHNPWDSGRLRGSKKNKSCRLGDSVSGYCNVAWEVDVSVDAVADR